MRLTIYIPTYQRPELRACLDSILPQLTDDCKLLVSDNDPAQSARPLCQNHRILYFSNHLNVGADGNCLRSITVSNSDYLWVFGDDDIMLPGAIEATLNMMNGQDRIVHVGEQHGEVTFGFNGTTAEWMNSLQDKSMIVASTLCTMNVWRLAALDPCYGIMGLDTRNVMCWAGVKTATVSVASKPYIKVGKEHPFPFDGFAKTMDKYLIAYRAAANHEPRFTLQDANNWNYVNV